MNIDTVKERLSLAHGDAVTIVESTYVDFKKHATFIDHEFGEWRALVYAICRGGRHPERFMTTKRITLEEAERRVFARHGSIVSIKKDTWTKQNDLCTFIDVEFGEWTARLVNVLSGIGHPKRLAARRSEVNKLSVEDVNERLTQVHGQNVKLTGVYTNICAPCEFTDIEFGQFTALPVNVLRGAGHIRRAVRRRRETSLERFGFEHPMQNNEVFTKNMRKRRMHRKATHWKTGQELDCLGSWEVKFVDWLTKNKYDFIWQPRAFKMPNGKSYRPDAFIIDMNLWVDVKGYYSPSSRAKCEWFKTIMSNFEVWEKDMLVELGII